MDVLIVIDMQNDFIDGSLKSKDGINLLNKIVEKVNEFNGEVVYTKDTHEKNYLDTFEGQNLPIEHCIRGTEGHEIAKALQETKSFKDSKIIEKYTFGSIKLGEYLKDLDDKENLENIYFVGLVADICVVSNILITKAFLPEKNIYLYKDLTEGLTDEKKKSAIDVLESCHIKII
ncbi:cysteine hydrolase [Peptoniphilus sp. MSJ-1]|uniref:Cysteine hydrolase n=1 Tax=Peptoniphilus ovalis TaxID=2841503 RepID=A0ABS6FH01_9FIRM|nr:isochorismatase family cysteine hydrolase [Peptoniphilus ovalis]MBU5669434.1 cysteine hydrolase [Peptoniphilus ovalis]